MPDAALLAEATLGCRWRLAGLLPWDGSGTLRELMRALIGKKTEAEMEGGLVSQSACDLRQRAEGQ